MKCPGQDMQFWNEAAIFEAPCPGCGRMVEFYKDDTNRKCHHCGKRVVNPKMDFGCASYCQYAEQCLGTLPEEFVGGQDNLLKDRVAVEVKRHLKTDFKRIGHITRLARHAETIGREEGGNLATILCAAYLLYLGEAEATATGSIADGAAVREGQRLAGAILGKLAAKEGMIREVCDLIEHYHRNQPKDTAELRVLADATCLAALEEAKKETALARSEIDQILEHDLQTKAGRQLGAKLFSL